MYGREVFLFVQFFFFDTALCCKIITERETERKGERERVRERGREREREREIDRREKDRDIVCM